MIGVSILNADPSIPLNSISQILQAALEAADPYELVCRNLEVQGDQLRVGNNEYCLGRNSRVVVVGLGKAGIAMTKAAEAQLGSRIERVVCVCKAIGTGQELPRAEVIQSAHPVPDERSVAAARRIVQVVQGLTKDDLVLLLLSGGGSALACLPSAGLSLADLQQVTNLLLKSGATINEINTVRRHLDDFKGGGFLRMAQPARVAVLVLSDVIGNSLEAIASGPAIKDDTSYVDALAILQKFGSVAETPAKVLAYLKERSALSATQEAGGNAGVESAYHAIIGSNTISLEAAQQKAVALGFQAQIVSRDLHGEARTACLEMLRLDGARPFVLLAGGETTVTVKGRGLGGRNLEVALGAVEPLSRLHNTVVATLATDGEDGPTDAAGAVVASASQPDMPLVRQCLENNDSYTYFSRLGGLIKTGPTGTNVNDITLVMGY
jgi:hydroxypyruvate reductase